MHIRFLRIAFILGALSVALGAFGAHALKNVFSAETLNTYETAIRYQLYHVFALALTGILHKEFANQWIVWAGKLFIAGIILFSGSLYLLCYFKTNELSGLYWVGIITPLGGLSFILAWLSLTLGLFKS